MTQAKPAAAIMQAIFRGIEKTSGAVGKYGGRTMLVLIIFIMVYDVIARYVFNRPTMWALEFAIYAQVLLVALSAAYVLREEGHVCIGLVIEQFSEKKRHWFICANSIIGALYCVVLSIQIWNTAEWSYEVSSASDTMGVPLAPLQFILLGGLVLLTLQFLARSHAYGKKARESMPQAAPHPLGGDVCPDQDKEGVSRNV
jgi:TRAP-type C4-dicarboxylate transport system permease small subunit